MLIEESIEKYDTEVREAINELWDCAYKNQKNQNDLVLVIANGSINNIPPESLKRLNISKYQIGHDFVHFRYSSFYDFINQFKRVRDEKEYESIEDKELYNELMIQMQLLLYMKFWETDLILKRIYNLSRLVQGEDYLWDVSQQILNDRRTLVKKTIQEPIKDICCKFSAFIDDIYSRQLRNAIAHSQYYLLYEEIQLTNKEENEHYKLSSISFKRWDEIYTKVVLMHNYMIDNFNKYHELYKNKVVKKQNGLLVYFPEKAKNGLFESAWIKYDMERNLWHWGNQ